jgi:ribonucleoside-diphosphate reductase alpha chain
MQKEMQLLKVPAYINTKSLAIAKGLTEADLAKVEKLLLSAFDITFVFNVWSLGEPTLQRLGFTSEQYNDVNFNLLRGLGFSKEEIEAANEYVCGTMTVEGAPFLKEEHYSVFDCANKCGTKGTRYIHASGHIRMMGVHNLSFQALFLKPSTCQTRHRLKISKIATN